MLLLYNAILIHTTVLPNREEKSLRHVAMVANFFGRQQIKTSLKKWVRAVSISSILLNFIYNLSNVGEIFWVESERTVSKFRKRKRKIVVLCLPTP